MPRDKNQRNQKRQAQYLKKWETNELTWQNWKTEELGNRLETNHPE